MGGGSTRPIDVGQPASGNRLAPGSLAGEYEILSELAAGSFGTVYAAQHRVLHRRAALKVLHRATPGAMHRFTREARSVNVIKHPNVVDVYEYGYLPDGRPYYVMEYLEGVTLEAFLNERGRLTPPAAFELLEPICGALTAAHDAGVIHRDVKPSNIFVSTSGVKLLDFGVAKLLYPGPSEPEITTIEEAVGTPAVMAPEQILNCGVDARTDNYSLGVVLFLALTGEYPFRGDVRTVLQKHVETPPPVPSSITQLSSEIDELVLRCLAKDPAKRYPSMDAFRAAFRHAVTARDPSSSSANSPASTSHKTHAQEALTPPSSAASLSTPVRRSWRLKIAALVVSGLAGGVLLERNTRSEATSRPAMDETKARPEAPTQHPAVGEEPPSPTRVENVVPDPPVARGAEAPLKPDEFHESPVRGKPYLNRKPATEHGKHVTTTGANNRATPVRNAPPGRNVNQEHSSESVANPPALPASPRTRDSPFLPQRLGPESPVPSVPATNASDATPSER